MLFREDKSVEELVTVEKIPFKVKEGDIIYVSSNRDMQFLEGDTGKVLNDVKKLKEELLKRDNY